MYSPKHFKMDDPSVMRDDEASLAMTVERVIKSCRGGQRISLQGDCGEF